MDTGRHEPNSVTEPLYHERLTRLRDAFPAPVSDRMHDAYFVFSILRALDGVDAMKSEVPLLGRPQALDYAAAEQTELAEESRSVEEVAHLLVGKLEGMPIWGHPRTQINVVPPPSIPSVIGSLLPAIYNPNLVSDDTSYGLMLTEAAVTAMASGSSATTPRRRPASSRSAEPARCCTPRSSASRRRFPTRWTTAFPPGA